LPLGKLYGEYMNKKNAIVIVIALVLGGCSISNETEKIITTLPLQIKNELPPKWTETPSLQKMMPIITSAQIISPTTTFLPTLTTTFRPTPTTTFTPDNKNPCQVSNPDVNSESDNYSQKDKTIIKMVSTLIGWKVDTTGEIFRTTDGGFHWKNVNHPKDNDEIYFVTSGCGPFFFALDADHAWDLPKWRTSDGGSTWQQASSIPTHDDFGDFLGTFVDYDFIDSQTGWMLWDDCCSNGKHSIYSGLFFTQDGGNTWKSISGDDSTFFAGFAFLSKTLGYSGGYYGFFLAFSDLIPIENYLTGKETPFILKTLDGGLSWQHINLPKLPISSSRKIPSGASTQLCGIYGIKKTIPNGIWARIYCYRKYQTDDKTTIEIIRAIPQSFSYYSPDGGNTWNSWIFETSPNSYPSWKAWVSDTEETFINQTTGWRLYSQAPDAPHALQHTTDGGHTWKTTSTVQWQKVQFNFLNEKTGFAFATIGDLTSLLRTDDGGMTWQEIKMALVE